MNLFCIKCLMFTKNNNIRLKREIDEKNNTYSCFNNCTFYKICDYH